MTSARDPLAHQTLDDMKEFVNKQTILAQLFPEVNDYLDTATEENMTESMRMFLKPDDAARDRYEQLQQSNPSGYATISEMLHMLTGKMPTPECVQDIESLMYIANMTEIQ